jgi:hypothetical protein
VDAPTRAIASRAVHRIFASNFVLMRESGLGDFRVLGRDHIVMWA